MEEETQFTTEELAAIDDAIKAAKYNNHMGNESYRLSFKNNTRRWTDQEGREHEQQGRYDDDHYQDSDVHPYSPFALRTHSFVPSARSTTTSSPGDACPSTRSARQRSPCTSTNPAGARTDLATAV